MRIRARILARPLVHHRPSTAGPIRQASLIFTDLGQEIVNLLGFSQGSSNPMPADKLKVRQVRQGGWISVVGFCLVLLLPLIASADTLTAKVVKVVDGDTLYVLDANYQQHKIRLAGIDAHFGVGLFRKRGVSFVMPLSRGDTHRRDTHRS